jgi:Golgi apparatus protein 1
MMTCLIEAKLAYDSRKPEDTSRMDDKCATAIEHWQILTMEDWAFSAQFKQSCTKDVRKFCEKRSECLCMFLRSSSQSVFFCCRTQSKLDVLMCLTESVQSDLMEDRPPKVSERCRAQLKFELLQKHADIKLDKKLVSIIVGILLMRLIGYR